MSKFTDQEIRRALEFNELAETFGLDDKQVGSIWSSELQKDELFDRLHHAQNIGQSQMNYERILDPSFLEIESPVGERMTYSGTAVRNGKKFRSMMNVAISAGNEEEKPDVPSKAPFRAPRKETHGSSNFSDEISAITSKGARVDPNVSIDYNSSKVDAGVFMYDGYRPKYHMAKFKELVAEEHRDKFLDTLFALHDMSGVNEKKFSPEQKEVLAVLKKYSGGVEYFVPGKTKGDATTMCDWVNSLRDQHKLFLEQNSDFQPIGFRAWNLHGQSVCKHLGIEHKPIPRQEAFTAYGQVSSDKQLYIALNVAIGLTLKKNVDLSMNSDGKYTNLETINEIKKSKDIAQGIIG